MNRTIKSLLFTTAAITAAAAGIYVAYRTRRKWIGRALNLPPAQYEVGAETHLRVPMPDGISLEAEHYYPLGEGSFPTILVRTPYGLSTDNSRPNTAIVNFPVQRFVERGYHVVLQSVRGRFGSEGRWIRSSTKRLTGAPRSTGLPGSRGSTDVWARSGEVIPAMPNGPSPPMRRRTSKPWCSRSRHPT
jgi:hypothetical protein